MLCAKLLSVTATNHPKKDTPNPKIVPISSSPKANAAIVASEAIANARGLAKTRH